jgi:hypothetical protein
MSAPWADRNRFASVLHIVLRRQYNYVRLAFRRINSLLVRELAARIEAQRQSPSRVLAAAGRGDAWRLRVAPVLVSSGAASMTNIVNNRIHEAVRSTCIGTVNTCYERKVSGRRIAVKAILWGASGDQAPKRCRDSMTLILRTMNKPIAWEDAKDDMSSWMGKGLLVASTKGSSVFAHAVPALVCAELRRMGGLVRSASKRHPLRISDPDGTTSITARPGPVITTYQFDQPRIARRPASVICRRSIVNAPSSTLSVSVTSFASPASLSSESVSQEKPWPSSSTSAVAPRGLRASNRSASRDSALR